MASGMAEARIAPARRLTDEERLSGAVYRVGENVVYPSQGVGNIRSIKQMDFRGTPTWYYEIYLPSSEMTVMAPVARAAELGIRAIVNREEALAALATLSSESTPATSDWKLRYQMNLDLLKKGTVIDIASVVRSLYMRSLVKELPVMERKLYDVSMSLLKSEIAFALGESESAVGEMIMRSMNPGLLDKLADEEGLSIAGDDEDDDAEEDEETSTGNDDDGDNDDEGDDNDDEDDEEDDTEDDEDGDGDNNPKDAEDGEIEERNVRTPRRRGRRSRHSDEDDYDF